MAKRSPSKSGKKGAPSTGGRGRRRKRDRGPGSDVRSGTPIRGVGEASPRGNSPRRSDQSFGERAQFEPAGLVPRAQSSQVLYGFHPVHEALRQRPQQVERLWTSAGGARLHSITELAERHRITVSRVDSKELTAIVESLVPAPADGGNEGVLDSSDDDPVHNGFVAELSARSEPGSAVDPQLVVLLEDVQDPRNLGAILRVCEGAGVGRVLVRDRGSAPMTPVVAKASAGASQWLDVERFVNTAQQLQALKDEGFWCYGADAEGVAPWQLGLTGKVVLCLGGEGSGLRHRTRGLCDALVGLPMRGQIQSLNVATAAAALLYEAVRQRTQAQS